MHPSIVRFLEDELHILLRPNWVKIILFLLLLLLIPIPYITESGSLGVSSVGDFEIIKSILVGNYSRQDYPLTSYFTPSFIQIFIIGAVVSYIAGATIIHYAFKSFSLHDKTMFRSIQK